MLVDEGKLKLDDEVAKYLPKYKDPLVISKFNDADASYETHPAKRPFLGIGHVDSRDNVRLIPNPCKYPTNQFPAHAYMSVAQHHLFQWVDKGIVPPNADRIWKDRNEKNDGSPMVMDEMILADAAKVEF